MPRSDNYLADPRIKDVFSESNMDQHPCRTEGSALRRCRRPLPLYGPSRWKLHSTRDCISPTPTSEMPWSKIRSRRWIPARSPCDPEPLSGAPTAPMQHQVVTRWRNRFPIFLLLPATAFAADAHTIVQKGRASRPAEVSINRGESLTFTNNDDFIHQIYVDGSGLFLSIPTRRIWARILPEPLRRPEPLRSAAISTPR